MENIDDTLNEKPKGNILQNENREDEASPENLKHEETFNLTEKVVERVASQPPIKTDQDLNKKNNR